MSESSQAPSLYSSHPSALPCRDKDNSWCVFFPSFSPRLFSHLPPLDPRDDQQHLSVTASQRVGRPQQTRAQSLYPQSTLATQHWSFTRDPQQTRAQKDKNEQDLAFGSRTPFTAVSPPGLYCMEAFGFTLRYGFSNIYWLTCLGTSFVDVSLRTHSFLLALVMYIKYCRNRDL